MDDDDRTNEFVPNLVREVKRWHLRECVPFSDTPPGSHEERLHPAAVPKKDQGGRSSELIGSLSQKQPHSHFSPSPPSPQCSANFSASLCLRAEQRMLWASSNSSTNSISPRSSWTAVPLSNRFPLAIPFFLISACSFSPNCELYFQHNVFRPPRRSPFLFEESQITSSLIYQQLQYSLEVQVSEYPSFHSLPHSLFRTVSICIYIFNIETPWFLQLSSHQILSVHILFGQ